MIDLPGEKHSGPLSLRTLQHRVAHSTSGSPLDTIFFKIRSTIVFEDPVDWPEAEASDARHFHTFTPLSRTSSIRLLNVAGLENTCDVAEGGLRTPVGTITLNQWYQNHQYVPPDRGVTFNAHSPPAVLRDVLVRGAWRVLAAPCPKLRGGHRSAHVFFAGCASSSVPDVNCEEKLPYRPEGFDHFQTEALNAGLALRSWAPHILQADPSARHQVEQVLRWVDDCMTKLSPMGICARQPWGQHIFESVFVLQCLLMLRSWRSTRKFKLAIKQGVSLVCPWDIAQSVNCLLDAKEIVLPDRTTLSRFHLVADAALMLYQRSRNSRADRASSPPARYMMADSSTQVGTDWMVSCYTEVAGEDLLPLSDGLDRLMGLRKTSSLVGHSETHTAEITSIDELITRSLSQHTRPPVGLGAGCGNLAHKAHALLHQFRLECESWSSVREFGKNNSLFYYRLGRRVGIT